MKSKFLITSTVVALCLASTSFVHAQGGKWATLKGQFIYDGDVPSMAKLTPTKDVEVCGKNQLFNEELIVNKENKGIANIVIWAYKPKKGVVHPDYAKTEKATVKMDNSFCRFEPHVAAVRTGQTFQIGNPDPVGHNSLINFLKNPPVNPLIPPMGKIDLKLKKAEIIPVSVSCSIHPWMKGIVLVQDHPYMAVTDKDGKFEIKGLPAGTKLTLKVWQEKAGYIQEVKIDGKKTAWKKGKYVTNLKKDEEHKYAVPAKVFKK